MLDDADRREISISTQSLERPMKEAVTAQPEVHESKSVASHSLLGL
jgi:hypothetical protein